MKKTLCFLLTALLLVLGLSPAALAEARDLRPDTVKIGIIQLMDHPSLAIIEASLREGLAELEAEGAIEILYGNANNEMSTAVTLANQFVAEGATLLVPITTPCAQAAVGVAKENPGVGVIFAAVTDPVAAGITGPDAPAGVPVTGVSDMVQVFDLLDMAALLTPGFETIGFLYNAGEANSVSSVALGKEYCEENGLKYVESIISSSSEIQQAALALAGQADILFTSNDNSIAGAMPVYAQVGLDTLTPIYVGADTMVADGGLATLGINYEALGIQTANMIYNYVYGTTIPEMPVEIMEDAQVIINLDTAEALGIEIPQELQETAVLIHTGDAL